MRPQTLSTKSRVGSEGSKSPSKVLCLYNVEIESRYKRDVGLTGILYLHSISDNRMTKLPPAILRRLLESENTCKVIIVTSMWNRIPRREIAERKERELCTMYWKEILDMGVNIDRFDEQDRTAHRIVSRLLGT